MPQSQKPHMPMSWPFREAQKILDRLEKAGADEKKKEIVFETGYGPSGLPHIGTFSEIARTEMVRQALQHLAPHRKTKLICFSDDMDGLRRIPENVPEREMLTKHLGKPLSSVPDPFGKASSFAEHNNGALMAFLKKFGFDCEFASATAYYKSGTFDSLLMEILERHDEIARLVGATLGEERRRTYSPFLPICKKTGRVLEAEVLEASPEKGAILYKDPETGKEESASVKGGACKLQWKVDWAMRWRALAVDYEMAGKDLNDSYHLSSRICSLLGGRAPEGFRYEMFLDEKGEKISKSKGNGLTLEDWLRYGPEESLSFFLHGEPKRARNLHFDVIPRNVNDYLKRRASFAHESAEERLKNPVWHIAQKTEEEIPVSFSQILSLAAASQSPSVDILWGFVRRHAPDTKPKTHPFLDKLLHHAIAYFEDFIAPQKNPRAPSAKEKKALEDLSARLKALPAKADAETIQSAFYTVGKTHGFEPLRDWFGALYEILLGTKEGPRFGSFVELYGVENTAALIKDALHRKEGA